MFRGQIAVNALWWPSPCEFKPIGGFRADAHPTCSAYNPTGMDGAVAQAGRFALCEIQQENVMKKSATEVMQEAVYAAVVDAIAALKAASGGVPNALVRDIGAIHPNTAFGDLPAPLQAAITASVRDAFQRLLKAGYAVAPNDAPPPRQQPAPTVVGRGQYKPPAGGRPQRPGAGPQRPGPGPGGPRKPQRPPR